MTIPKPKKPVEDPKSYRPISLVCVPCKILERLIHARVGLVVDPLLPREQAGFRRGRSTVDQTVLLTQNIENSFGAKKKAGAVFVNLIAAYDTVWHRGLTCKLLRLLSDKHMVVFFVFAVFILHSRESDVSLCIGRYVRTRLGVAISGSPVFHIKMGRPVKCLAQGHNKRTCRLVLHNLP